MSQPEDGPVVRANVRARLFGLRLLEVDATVVVTQPRAPLTGARAVRVGAGLADARRMIGEGQESLAVTARSNGHG